MFSPDVTVLLPVLNRPHRIIPVVSSIVQSTENVEIIIIPSAGLYVAGMDEVLRDVQHFSRHVFVWPYDDHRPECGNYAKKINQALRFVHAPWVFTGADDLDFHPGWFVQCQDTMRSHPQARVIGTNDLGHPRVFAMHETATHSLVNLEYAMTEGTIDERGKILHEGYVHEFVDDELVGTAKHRGVWAFSMLSHVEHLHPVWGKAAWDSTYDDQGRRLNVSRALFASRCPLWGGQPI